MNSYEQYLSKQRIIPDKKIPFFLHWVKRCYNHCKKPTSAILGQDEIDAFLKQLAKQREDWQVDQARMAIHIYTFHKNQITESHNKTASASKQWTTIKDEMVKIMRLKHLSMSSERTYIGWIRSFGRFLSFRSPEQINGTQAKAFLT